ncbi:hypothetical protein KIN20_001033 [Parelaphostrongylus tenuis]|nr:hypothetical protein KIN20_001033 [Parelaphostrongylus tenuis]
MSIGMEMFNPALLQVGNAFMRRPVLKFCYAIAASDRISERYAAMEICGAEGERTASHVTVAKWYK